MKNKLFATSCVFVSSSQHMRRAAVLVAGIVLSYMAIVNVFIAKFLYTRYMPVQTLGIPMPRPIIDGPKTHLQETRPYISPSIASALDTASSKSRACAHHPRLDIAVVIGHTHMVLSNNPRVQPEIVFLALLQSELASTEETHCRVLLVMEAGHFVAAYRVWCEALTVATHQRCACELTFVNAVAKSAVAAHVHQLDVCMQGLFLVAANSTFPTHMLVQSAIKHHSEVVCLTQHCTGLALFLPERFLRWQAAQDSHLDSQIVAQATGMHMIAQHM